MSEVFRKMCLHYQALYEDHEEPDDVNTFCEKLRSF